MLVSQRALFDIPRDVCYLNAAGWSPLPLATQAAARAAVARKGQPWKLGASFATDQHERARQAAARLINADPADVALTPSISYGIATAAKILDVPKGSRVIVLQDDHTSPVLEWQSRAEPQGLTIDTVAQPGDGDWTSAVLAAIDHPNAQPPAVVSISSIHWSDGGAIDLMAVVAKPRRPRQRRFSSMPPTASASCRLDVKALDPDFVFFPTYKWTLGPYGRAFMYIARRHQDGVPLEQTAPARRDVRAESKVYFADTRYVDDARRFDMGERDHFISLEMASIGMELVASWGAPALVERLRDADRPDRRWRKGVAGRGARSPAAGAAYSEPRLQGRGAAGADRGTGR